MTTTWGGTRATRIRRALATTLPRDCWRCGQTINRTDEWDVGHRVSIAQGGAVWDPANLAPECAGPCNRSAGAREGNLARSGRTARRRPW